MDSQALKKSYLKAAIVSAAITGAILVYAAVGEVLRHAGLKPLLQPPASYAVKYVLYFLAVSPLLALKFVAPRFAARRATPEETVKALTAGSVVTAALCELPGIAGLLLLLLAGGYQDFYLLLAFAAALEAWHFPRLGRWEERLRGDFGKL